MQGKRSFRQRAVCNDGRLLLRIQDLYKKQRIQADMGEFIVTDRGKMIYEKPGSTCLSFIISERINLMLKYVFKLFILPIFFLFLISSCSALPFFSTPTPKPRSDWITKWLKNPTCQPPCWENMIPGKTKIEDGVTILEQIPGINKLSGPSKGPIGNEKQMVWQFGPSSGSISAQTDERGEILSFIYLNLNLEENITLDELVSAYGQPTNLSFYDCRTELNMKSCVIHLIYKDKGMALELLVDDIGKGEYRVKILSETKVSGVWLFPATGDGYATTIGKNSFIYPKFVINWKGYTNYP